MMFAGKIYCNGVLVDPHRERLDAETLLRNNYVYAAVNTLGHKPLYLERHLHYAASSYEKLYGKKPELDMGKISFQIPKLLYENRLPARSNIVNIYLLPEYGEKRTKKPTVIMSVAKTTVYQGYELLSLRPKSVVANYEIPFAEHRTAVSLTAAGYMDEFAARSGAHISLRTNRSGNLVSAGDYPVFAVKQGKVMTPEAARGAGESVERELMVKACERASVELEERDIAFGELPDIEEIMVFNHSGIQSVLSCGGMYFYNLTALELEKQLPVITREGL